MSRVNFFTNTQSAFTNPRHNLYHSDLYEGMHVGDFGVGAGAYTMEALPFVSHDGQIYAIDIQKGLLERLERTLSEGAIENVQYLHGDLEEREGSRLRDEILDFGVASNIFFQVRRKKNLLEEIRRTLRPRGKFLLVDWKDSFQSFGPRREDLLHPNDARLLAELAGFRYVKMIPAGEYHYGMIFEKK